MQGLVRGLNTIAYAEGDLLYLGTSGTLTGTKPVEPNSVVEVALVVTSNAGTGIIYVQPEIVHPIEESSDVKETAIAVRDILIRNATNEYYENSNLDTELADLVKSVTMNATTYVLTITYWDNTTDTIDLPTESSIVGISYDNTTKDLTFTLRSGATTAVPLDAIITGLASETYVNNAYVGYRFTKSN
ncbi:hypothetical protein THIOSC13_1830001 [uncultured Thiomicrorhabdus sp.]